MKNALLLLLLGVVVFAASPVNHTSILPSQIRIENESMYSPYPAEPGQYVDIWVRVRHAGFSGSPLLRDTVCEIIPRYPFSLDPDESGIKNIGTLSAAQPVVLKYRLQVDANAAEGNNEIGIRCKDADSDWTTITLRIYVQTHDAVLSLTDFQSSPETFLSGKNGEAKLTVQNLADSPLKDISVFLDLSNTPFAPLQDSSQRNIKELASGESSELSVNLITSPSAEVGIYRIPITLTYADILGKNYTKNSVVALIVGAEPNLFFSLESTTLIQDHTKGRVTIIGANQGLSSIQFLTAKMLPSNDYRIISSDEKYMGNIDPDETTSADFEIFMESGKKQVTLPFQLRYVDGFGKLYEETRNVTIPLFSETEAIDLGLVKPPETNPLLSIGLGLLVIVLLWQGWKFLSKSRKK